jgi:hypothetical protein
MAAEGDGCVPSREGHYPSAAAKSGVTVVA